MEDKVHMLDSEINLTDTRNGTFCCEGDCPKKGMENPFRPLPYCMLLVKILLGRAIPALLVLEQLIYHVIDQRGMCTLYLY